MASSVGPNSFLRCGSGKLSSSDDAGDGVKLALRVRVFANTECTPLVIITYYGRVLDKKSARRWTMAAMVCFVGRDRFESTPGDGYLIAAATAREDDIFSS